MAIENAIAQFGLQAGRDIQNTVGNAIARAENRSRYEDQKNMLLADREREAAALQDKAERDHFVGGATAIVGAPAEQQQQVYAGWYQDAARQGFDLAGVPTPDQYNPEVGLKMAGAAGIELPKPSSGSSTNLGKLLAERDALPEGDPRRAFYDDAITKASSTASGPKGTPKAFQPEQYIDEQGNTAWGIPTFDPNTNTVTMKPLEGLSPLAEEKPLSPTTQKILDDAQTKYFESDRKAREFEVLASDIDNRKGQFGGGLGAKWREAYKDATGNQDAVSELRRAYLGVRASQAVTNLPPGVASDKDIELALSGFPSEKANAQQVASFLRGMAKLERLKAEFNSFRAQLISEQGSTKNLISKWKDHAETIGAYEATPDETESQQTIPEGYSLMEDASGNRAYVGPDGEIIEAQ